MPKDDLISASGTSHEIVKALGHAVKNRGGDVDDLRRILRDDTLCDELATRIVAVPDDFEVARPIANTIHVLIQGCRFDRVNSHISDETFESRAGDTAYENIKLYRADRWMETHDVVTGMGKLSLRPVDLTELLLLAATYPDLQRHTLIVGLGSAMTDDRGTSWYPNLFGDTRMRGIGLLSEHNEWRPGDCFAGIYEEGLFRRYRTSI